MDLLDMPAQKPSMIELAPAERALLLTPLDHEKALGGPNMRVCRVFTRHGCVCDAADESR